MVFAQGGAADTLQPPEGGDAPNIPNEGAGMKWDVARVEPLDQYRLHVELVDGRQGSLDMTPYLEKGLFRELKDPTSFRQVQSSLVR